MQRTRQVLIHKQSPQLKPNIVLNVKRKEKLEREHEESYPGRRMFPPPTNPQACQVRRMTLRPVDENEEWWMCPVGQTERSEGKKGEDGLVGEGYTTGGLKDVGETGFVGKVDSQEEGRGFVVWPPT